MHIIFPMTPTKSLVIALLLVASCSQSPSVDDEIDSDSLSGVTDTQSLHAGDSSDTAKGTAGTDPTPSDTATTDTATQAPLLPWTAPTIDTAELPADIPTVNIVISSQAQAALEADPYDGPDQTGQFTDSRSGTYNNVDLNYRGAYQLQNLINYSTLRNWKVKFPKATPYRERREWNFNWEPNLRQKLALDLLKFAGVKVPSSPQHVVLQVNGVTQGLYLSYEDPDNKDWLWEQFGNDNGDLFKAAYDKPYITTDEKCWADFTILGATDADYKCHYNKKTNHKVAPDDYSTIRLFIEGLNNTPAGELEAWLDTNFQVDQFISYLVVSNFIANWDGYPQRPKNFWVYQDLRAGQIVFIPWDLDGTFHSTKNEFNQMGTNASVLYDLITNDYTPYHVAEGEERPLARRLLAIPAIYDAYLARYRELTSTILTPQFIQQRMDALTAIINQGAIPPDDKTTLQEENGYMMSFVNSRYNAVTNELATLL